MRIADFKTLLRRRPRRSVIRPEKCIILEQPYDIIMCITDHLPLESIVAFGLTCKVLRHLLQASIRKLSSNENVESKRAFLIILEQKALGKERFYCYRCNKLHFYDNSWRLQDPGFIYEGSVAPRDLKFRHLDCFIQHRAFWQDASIDFPHPYFRLIMNRDSCGPTHGLPLSTLKHTLERKDPKPSFPGVAWTISWTPRIIQGQLFIRGTHVLAHTKGGRHNPVVLRLGVDRIHHYLCPHLRTSIDPPGWQQHDPQQPAPLRRPTDTLEMFKRCHEFESCSQCLMDWEVTIKDDYREYRRFPILGEKKKIMTFSVEVQTYHLLGDGRSPLDWRWQAFIGESTAPRCIRRCPPDFVRGKWLES